MNKDAAVKIIENIVAFSKYESSNDAHEIAEFCQMVSIGKDEDEEVKELRPHETQAQKDQRARQYHSLSQYASNKILNYVRRLKSVEDAIVSYQDISDEQAQKLKEAVKDFYDEKDLLEYIIEQYANGQGKDPNALLLLASEDTYDNTGALIDRKAIPKIIPSEKVIQVIENQGVIKFGIIKEVRSVYYDASNNIRPKFETKQVIDLYLYADNLTMIFISDSSVLKSAMEIDIPPVELDSQVFTTMRIQKQDGTFEQYKVYTYDLQGFPCPLVSMSGRKDPMNESVKSSILCTAKPQFKELISRVSELNVAISCHVYPQKIMVVPECDYVDTDSNICESGSCGGKTCPSCKGTGKKFHISSQDIITVTIPKNATPSDMPDISKMIHYATHDEFAPKFLEQQITNVLTRLSDTVFETNIFASTTVAGATTKGTSMATPQNGVAETATKTAIDWQKLYLSLKSDAEHIEKIYALIAKYQSVLLFGANNIKIKLNFPKDFKFATLDELIGEYQKATAAGLPFDVVQKILTKIIEKQNPDDAESLMWVLLKQRHKPFSDKTPQEVAVIIQSRAYDDFDRACWENFDSIFDELQEEEPSLIGKTYMEQKEVIKNKVEQMVLTIKEATGNDLNTLFNTVGN